MKRSLHMTTDNLYKIKKYKAKLLSDDSQWVSRLANEFYLFCSPHGLLQPKPVFFFIAKLEIT